MQIWERRAKLWHRYFDGLGKWAEDSGVELPTLPAHCGTSYHLFHLVSPLAEARDELMAHLRRRGIMAVFHYLPLNTSMMGKRLGGYSGQCPVSENVSERFLRLPLYYGLRSEEQEQVIEAVLDYRV